MLLCLEFCLNFSFADDFAATTMVEHVVYEVMANRVVSVRGVLTLLGDVSDLA